jgi:hypothetical protein
MDGANSTAGRQILSSVMHHIDLSNQAVHKVQISATSADLQGYLEKLLAEIQSQPNKRAYSHSSNASEFATCLANFSSNLVLPSNHHADLLAERLMREEVDSTARHPNLNPIAKGSFLQFTYRDGTFTRYLGVKIEHSTYIDVNDLIRKSGLADDRKLYKAVSVGLEATNNQDIHVFDTNGTPAAYWWKNFLELQAQRNDSENTKNAIEAVIKTIGLLKNDYPADHSLLRNAAIAAFKKKTVMRFEGFIDDLLSNYVPIDPMASAKLSIVEQKLRQLPTIKKFDSQFELDPSVVPYRKRKLILSPEISLSIDEGIDNIGEKIWASKTTDGRNILVIQTENVRGFGFKG